MQVSVLYFADCPNWRDAGRRMREALDEVGCSAVEIAFVPVETDEQAAAVGFAGSPTCLVDGRDLFDASAVTCWLSCRLYATDGGVTGVPEVPALVAALRDRIGR